MLGFIRKWGYEDVMQYIWFCHRPIANKACGLCHPCELKIDCGMCFLLDQQALNRNRIKKVFKKLGFAKVHVLFEKGMRSIYRRRLKEKDK